MMARETTTGHVWDNLGFNPYGPLSQFPYFPEEGDDAEWIYLVQRYTQSLGIDVALWRKGAQVQRKVFATGPIGVEPLPEDEMKEVLSLIEKQDPSLPISKRIELVVYSRMQFERVEYDWTPVIDEVTTISEAEFKTVCDLAPTLLAGSADMFIERIAVHGVIKTRKCRGEFSSSASGMGTWDSFWEARSQLISLAGIEDLPFRATGKRIRD